MLLQGFGQIALSTACVYLFIVIAIRLFGHKELAQLSVIDLVFILLISNAVQNAMVGQDSTLAGGLVAAGTLFISNYLLKLLFYRFPRLGRLVQGEAIMLIYHGKVIPRNLTRARLTLAELREAAREHGVGMLEEVNLAVLEVDGQISVLSDEFRRRTTKRHKAHRVVGKTGE